MSLFNILTLMANTNYEYKFVNGDSGVKMKQMDTVDMEIGIYKL